MLVAFHCNETISSHDYVLVDVTVGASKAAAVGMVAVPCPDCGEPMDPTVIE